MYIFLELYLLCARAPVWYKHVRDPKVVALFATNLGSILDVRFLKMTDWCFLHIFHGDYSVIKRIPTQNVEISFISTKQIGCDSVSGVMLKNVFFDDKVMGSKMLLKLVEIW